MDLSVVMSCMISLVVRQKVMYTDQSLMAINVLYNLLVVCLFCSYET